MAAKSRYPISKARFNSARALSLSPRAAGDAEDGCGRVPADAGQGQRVLRRPRKPPLVFTDDLLSGAVQIARAAVVAEAGPGFEHCFFRHERERADGGESREEALVVGKDGGDTRLLEHYLGDPDAVGVGGFAPGKGSLALGEPVEQAALKGAKPAAGWNGERLRLCARHGSLLAWRAEKGETRKNAAGKNMFLTIPAFSRDAIRQPCHSESAATGDARRLLARSRLPPIRGHTPSAPRYGLRRVGCLKQMPNAVFQQFDSPLQSAELSNPHHGDGQAQLK
jgi:hypothetical protein